MKRIATLLMSFFFLSGITYAENSISSKDKEVKIKTSAKCKMCKSRLERTLNLSSGVTDARLNLDDKVMTVKYRSNRTLEEKIRNLIAKTGYQAEDVHSVASGHDRLPKCLYGTPHEHMTMR